jgi:hypothetical protein
LPPALSEKLQKLLEAGVAGPAFNELNGTNLLTGETRMAMDASRQFNAAFGDLRGGAAMKNFIGRAAQREFADRQSAGGKPTRNVETRHALSLPTEKLTGFVKAYGGFGSQGSTRAAAG